MNESVQLRENKSVCADMNSEGPTQRQKYTLFSINIKRVECDWILLEE